MDIQRLQYYFNEFCTFYPIKNLSVWEQKDINWLLLGENKAAITGDMRLEVYELVYPKIEGYYGHKNFELKVMVDFFTRPHLFVPENEYKPIYVMKVTIGLKLPGSKKNVDVEYKITYNEFDQLTFQITYQNGRSAEVKQVTSLLQELEKILT